MNRFLKINLVFILGALLAALSCDSRTPTSSGGMGGPGQGGGDEEEQQEQNSQTIQPFTSGTRIAWDFRTRTLIDPDPSSYPRMIRLDNGNLLAAYEDGGTKVRISTDDGATWGDEIMAQENVNGIIAANPELLQLDNGDILLAYNERPNENPEAPYTARVKISRDGGQSWSHLSTAYTGGTDPGRGVWEPVMIQTGTGEIQLYFANENPYPDNDDQEISMCRSINGGETWSEAETISYRPGHRDGMPVPLILNNGDLVMTIEDSGIDPTERRLKPAVIKSTTGAGWGNAPVGANSSNRWRALSSDWHLPDGAKGGAPYIDQFPSGETVLSFQSQLKYVDGEQRILEEPSRNMLVAVGSPEARDFRNLSAPFDVQSGERAVWGSIFVKDASTLTAITTTNALNENGDHNQVYAIDGHRIPDMEAPRATITVDGALDEEAWDNAATNFIGAYSQANADIHLLWDDEYLYAGFQVRDTQVTDDSEDPMQDDGVVLYLAPDSLSKDAPSEGAYRIVADSDSSATLYTGVTAIGGWERSTAEGLNAVATLTAEGYDVELAIPWELIGGPVELNKGWGLNIGLMNDDGGPVHYESLSGNRKNRPSTWSRISLVE